VIPPDFTLVELHAPKGDASPTRRPARSTRRAAAPPTAAKPGLAFEATELSADIPGELLVEGLGRTEAVTDLPPEPDDAAAEELEPDVASDRAPGGRPANEEATTALEPSPASEGVDSEVARTAVVDFSASTQRSDPQVEVPVLSATSGDVAGAFTATLVSEVPEAERGAPRAASPAPPAAASPVPPVAASPAPLAAASAAVEAGHGPTLDASDAKGALEPSASLEIDLSSVEQGLLDSAAIEVEAGSSKAHVPAEASPTAEAISSPDAAGAEPSPVALASQNGSSPPSPVALPLATEANVLPVPEPKNKFSLTGPMALVVGIVIGALLVGAVLLVVLFLRR
jgi:nicotinate-nucleotide--dimethylbenzimidazole phosphoribosyltransferase